jgi:hypothetical protein
MAEYLLLATFITVLSIATVWTVRTFQQVGKALYQAILPSSRGEVNNLLTPAEELPTLCEKLATVPMPWGWHPLKLSRVQSDTHKLPRSPLVIPWGWPGSNMRINGKARPFPATTGSTMYGRRAIHNGSGVSVGTDIELAEDSSPEIRRNHPGGYVLVTAGRVHLREARSPWGW